MNGESWSDVEVRLRSFLLTLQLECSDRNVVICGHGKTDVIWKKIFLGWTGEKAIAEYEKNPPPNASVTIYKRKKDKLVLELANFAPWKEPLTLPHFQYE